jgi:hypothetical protein
MHLGIRICACAKHGQHAKVFFGIPVLVSLPYLQSVLIEYQIVDKHK